MTIHDERYAKRVIPNVHHLSVDTLKDLYRATQNRLRVLWHQAFFQLLTYLDEKFLGNVRAPHCEPYQLWITIPETTFNYFHQVVLPTLHKLSSEYPIPLRVFATQHGNKTVFPYTTFQEPAARKQPIIIIMGVDIPHEDYGLFHETYTKHPKPSSINFLKEKISETLRHNNFYGDQNWPPSDADALPGANQWPQLCNFPDFHEVEDRLMGELWESIE